MKAMHECAWHNRAARGGFPAVLDFVKGKHKDPASPYGDRYTRLKLVTVCSIDFPLVTVMMRKPQLGDSYSEC
jgi:hypothetical protein